MNMILFLVLLYVVAILVTLLRCYTAYKEYCVENKYTHEKIEEAKNAEHKTERDLENEEVVLDKN